VRTLIGAVLLRREELSRLTARVIHDVRPLPVPQRVAIIEQLVGDDPQVAAALLPTLRKAHDAKRARRRGTHGIAVVVRRDGVM
jgi:hypothetical protein